MFYYSYYFLLGLIALLLIVIIVLIRRNRNTSSQSNHIENESRYTELVRLLPQTIIELDLKGRITFLNDFGFQFLTLSEYDLKNGVLLKDLLVKNHQNRFYQDLLYVIEGGLNKGQEYLVNAKGGSLTPIMIYFSTILKNDQVVGIRGVIIDMKRVKELERRAYQAVIDTEEKERKRYSEDLHDGLGPLLSTIKLYLNQLNTVSIIEGEGTELIMFTNKLIDESISTTRTIANNILPGAIEDNGLWVAILAFCDKIEKMGSVKFQLTNSTNLMFNNKSGNTIYRMVIELINNTIKHANADLVKINFELVDEDFKLVYSDNGVGFQNQKNEGLGISNIRNRAASLNGLCGFYTSDGMRFELLIPLNEVEH